MSHPEAGRLRTFLDGETTPDEARLLEGHLAACAACANALERMREDDAFVTATLPTMDVSPPTERVRATLPKRRRGPRGADLARAAALVLGFAGVVTAAVHPSSPLRRWIAHDGTTPTSTPSTTPSASASVTPEVGVRLAVPPAGVTIALADAPAGTPLEVTWIEGAAAAVYAAEGTSFGTSESEGRIDANGVAGPVRIELPRSTGRAEVVVGGRVYLEKAGERVDYPGPPALVDGHRVRFVVP